jgi:PPOX class probable F420-dependent enzyme
VTADEARARFASARVARLATAGPHLVPVVFAVDGDTIWSAVDAKPKRTRALRRLANIARDPRVALLADHYEDANWSALWWARADGEARVLDASPRALELLAGRYPQYVADPPAGPFIAVDVARWSGWSAS